MADNLGFGAANPYLQPAIDAAQGDLVRNYNLRTAPAFTSAMVNSGSFGNSGLQQMQQDAEGQLQQNLGRVASDMRYGDYWNNLGFNKSVYDTTFNQNQQQFGNALSVLGLGNQAGVQNLGLGTQIQNTPLNYYQGFANTANGIGQGYGTSSGTSSASGSPLLGALGGWQLGGQIGKSFGGWGGGGSNTQFPEYGMASGATGGWV
jgi:hypothetical protein